MSSCQLRVGRNILYKTKQKQVYYIFFVHIVLHSAKGFIENLSQLDTLSLLQKSYVRVEAPP